MNIYVGNLPYKTDDDDLRELFSEYGEVTRVSLIKDKMTGQSKGFGFVEMADAGDAATAISSLNDHSFGGRNIKVNEARPREERPRRDFNSRDRDGGAPRRRDF